VDPFAAALGSLALLGLLDALYFTLVAYRVLAPDAAWLPRVCRMDEGTCARVVDAPEARLLRIPNSVLGLGWYALVLLHALRPLPCAPLLLLGAASVAMSAYLAWALLRKLRAPCPLCFLGHGINAALLLLLLAQCA
jgi:uncharacterized membrane protein